MPFEEDFDAFLDIDEGLATQCVYKGREIAAVFSKEEIEVNLTQGYAPMLLVKDSDIEDIAQADSITVGVTVYTVREYWPDGTGMTKLILEAT